MKVKWIRGNEHISFKRPNVWFGLGVRGSGKSSFLEHVGEEYLNRGATIFDLFSARDGESLAWLRSPYAKDKKILLVHGENVSVSSSVDSKNAGSLTLNDVEHYDIIISSSPLYSSPDQEFLNAAKITDLLYKRLHWKRVVYLIMREASNFYYSRLKITESQTVAKANMVYLIRESRHCGLSLALDSVRFFSIDIDIRTLADYLILKSQGMQGLSRDLKWLYSYVEPHLVRQLKPNQFILLTKKGGISYGVFPEVGWHKKEQEDILKVLGIKRDFTEPIQESIFKGSFKTVGDKEHAEILRLYIEDNMSMGKIADKLERSPRTIQLHIQHHNKAVQRKGFCGACKRVGSEHHNVLADRQF
jgi:hypothetical protein